VAQFLGRAVPVRLLLRELVSAAVVVDDVRVVDRDVRGAALEVVDRIAAVRHDALDQLVGRRDGAAGVVDELRLHVLPARDVALARGRRQGRMSSSARRSCRAASSDSAFRLLSENSTVRSYSGPNCDCSCFVRRLFSIDMTIAATTTTIAIAMTIHPQVGTGTSSLVPRC
jgi:hypothetical protein